MIKIINQTSLSYSQVGELIDLIIKTTDGETHYYGQIQGCNVKYDNMKIRIQIRYLKQYVEWNFEEVR